MAAPHKFILQISASKTNWSVKVIVVRKQFPKTARNSNSRYQNLTLMDLERKEITATMYDANITALNNQFELGKTNIVSNATVKDFKSEFRSFPEQKMWNVTGRTNVEELNEDNLNVMFSKFELTAFK
ncbi:Hypothetical predicted protein [Olea europaea subsp. europaea]|uniref:Replication protein A 70 kDa DNA-binding subunit B/D first OB fold domain-containing protein n=1 Tax=Olea europaea subsp. europaea TaxID=158383 RepID=A0A8S0U254_OLEEU|nr:Hypothetical predicted protein [Olea europaea subsp. europaea]